jgi:RHS repeat-associated protein
MLNDKTLRLEKKSYYDAGNVLIEEISYTYDGTDKRTSKRDRFGTENYNSKAEFQLDTISGASSENYDFDANGRLNLVQRDGKTIDLDHDAGDRLTSVENEMTGKTMQHQYDGAGNRVGAIEGTDVRQFLVAPAMGSGLESSEAIGDASGNLMRNYVYAGENAPFMMLDANGNPTYYLTDAMGTVIGLSDTTGQEVADFRYDAFGNDRGATGSAASSGNAKGDFRFQGQWLESESGIYYFRARDYDTQTGTFISRDPLDIIDTQPESMNPYQFAYNNPYVYSDPTGMFSITEVNASQVLQDILSSSRTYVSNQAKEYLKERVGDAVSEIVGSVFKNFVPGFSQGNALLSALNSSSTIDGNSVSDVFEAVLGNLVCEYFDALPLVDSLRFFPRILSDGTPASGGLDCGNHNDPQQLAAVRINRGGGSRPDFIFIQGAFKERNPNSYLIGDIKLTQRAAYDDVMRGDNQWLAMSNYANRYQQLPFVSYISLLEAIPGAPGQRGRGVSKSDRRKMTEKAIERGVIVVLANLID